MDKQVVIHTPTGILLNHKKRRKFCHFPKHGTGIMLSEISQDRERQILQLLLICEMKQMNNRNRLTEQTSVTSKER